MAGKFPLRSPWFMDQRNGLLYGAFTVKGETAQAVVWNDYFFEAGITANLALTEGNDSLTADGTVQGINATLSIVEGNDTLSAAATHAVSAVLAVIEDDDTITSNGSGVSAARKSALCWFSLGMG